MERKGFAFHFTIIYCQFWNIGILTSAYEARPAFAHSLSGKSDKKKGMYFWNVSGDGRNPSSVNSRVQETQSSAFESAKVGTLLKLTLLRSSHEYLLLGQKVSSVALTLQQSSIPSQSI